jgi:hypothetical protein
MPIYTIPLNDKTTETVPRTLPVIHKDRKVALAAFDETKYTFNLPHSLSYLVQMGAAVPTLMYAGQGDPSSDTDTAAGELLSIVLVYRPRVPAVIKRFPAADSLRA